MAASIATPIDYEAEFKHLRNEVQILKEGFLSVITQAQSLCDNVSRFKVALERVEALEKSAESAGKMPAIIEARHVKEKLWEAIMVDAEEVSLRISQLPPGASFLDANESLEGAKPLAEIEATAPAPAPAPARKPTMR